MSRVARLLAVPALLLTMAACSSPDHQSVSPEEAQKLLLDRNWLDHMPKSTDEKLQVYRFVPKMGGGVYQERTMFFGTFELFRFENSGDEIRFDLLHTGDKKTVKYRIESLKKGEAEPFDLRLTIDGSPRGPNVYYGFRSEGAGTDLDAELQEILNKR